jgi:hypothetical protein
MTTTSANVANRSLPARWGIAVAVLLALCTLAVGVARAAADSETAWWQLTSGTRPTVLKPLKPGEEATFYVRAANLGEAAVSSRVAPVKITDKLPEGMKAESAYGFAGSVYFGENPKRGEIECPVLGSVVTCEWSRESLLEPYEQLQIYIKATGTPSGAKTENTATVTGGETYRCVPAPRFREGDAIGPFCEPYEETEPGRGAFQGEATHSEVPPASLTRPISAANEETGFGLSDFSAVAEGENGFPDTQAASNPLQLTTTFALNETGSETTPPAFADDLQIKLPAGLVGDAQAVPKCSSAVFAEIGEGNVGRCPNDTAVGVAIVNAYVSSSSVQGLVSKSVPVFNLPAGEGEPARFGFQAEKVVVIIDTSVRNGTDYGVVTKVSGLTEFAQLYSSTVTIWGTPGAAEHRLSRGWSCVGGGTFWTLFENDHVLPECTGTSETSPHPLLRMPTSCNTPLAYSAEVSSWLEPNHYLAYTPADFGHEATSLSGCGQVPFDSTFTVAPDTQAASSPAALTVKLHVSQETAETAGGIAPSDVRDTMVTLPVGFTVNTASGAGLAGCSEQQIGYEPGQSTSQQQTFTAAQPSCPNASKLGTVTIKSPDLEHELEGSIYLAAPQNNPAEPQQNPFRALVALYIVAEEPSSGVLLKLPGKLALDPTTGRVTATFENAPQDPVEELEVKFFPGPRAALATPAHCGTYPIETAITPWSGNAPAVSTSDAVITAGPGGGPCSGTLPFAPTFTAGTTATQAGSYSPFTLTFARQDGEQDLNSIEQTLPPGLLAKIAGVPRCGEAQANEGAYPQASQIGTVTVAAGVGSEPLYVNGTIYLTGPYNNGPFGIAVEVPAIAGPFDLDENGRPVVVRGSIRINPTTAQATVVSNAFPTILQGIVLNVRTVNVTLNRPGFTFNPTDCVAQNVTATISSIEGANAGVSSPFGAVNCATLPFKPTLTATTVGRASKPGGASLVVKVTSKGGPGTSGEEANIRSVKVDLPKQLPSRLTTLQKACTAAQFEANPAGCPKESDVGTATANTPVLAVPLTGPAYLVSHGGEAFPDLEMVLQGEGVKLVLDGNTLIKKGITSSTFRTVPDAPISSFELRLPTGKFSILGTNLPQGAHYNLCGQTLNMPTAITGQNGVEIHERTKIGVSGCAKKRPAKKHAKKRAKRPVKKRA